MWFTDCTLLPLVLCTPDWTVYFFWYFRVRSSFCGCFSSSLSLFRWFLWHTSKCVRTSSCIRYRIWLFCCCYFKLCALEASLCYCSYTQILQHFEQTSTGQINFAVNNHIQARTCTWKKNNRINRKCILKCTIYTLLWRISTAYTRRSSAYICRHHFCQRHTRHSPYSEEIFYILMHKLCSTQIGTHSFFRISQRVINIHLHLKINRCLSQHEKLLRFCWHLFFSFSAWFCCIIAWNALNYGLYC